MELDVSNLKSGGRVTVTVTCAAPSYVTLHVEPHDDAVPNEIIALEPVGNCRYVRHLSLASRPRRAWIEVAPGEARARVSSASITPIRRRDIALLAWRAALRHAFSPQVFAAKARQALSARGNVVFSGASKAPPGDEARYKRWQQAFESDPERKVLLASLEATGVCRPVRVLGVVLSWAHADAALNDAVGSLSQADGVELHLLDLRPAAAGAAYAAPDLASQLPSSAAGVVGTWQAIATAQAAVAADLMLFFERPGRFSSMTAAALMLALVEQPSAVAAYGDHDQERRESGRTDPVFKPNWSPDYLSSFDYIGQPVAFRPSLFTGDVASFPLPELCPSFALLLQLGRHRAATAVAHVPRILFHEHETEVHWADARATAEADAVAQVLAVEVTSSPAPGVRRVRRSCIRPTVCVVVPTKDQPRLLSRLHASVVAENYEHLEIAVIDNGSVSREQSDLLARLAADRVTRIIGDSRPFNFSQLINLGRSTTTADVLLLLNDDVEAMEPGWLTQLACNAMRPEVGCVGAVLLYPDHRVQHGGIVIGINGGSGHAFRFAPEASHGAGARLVATHEVSAVTGACLAVRAELFDAVGGFDEGLPVALNDVDFCLKVRARGLRNLLVPEVRLIHRESASRGLDSTPEKLVRLSRETATFRRRWGRDAIVDPYYSPHLTPNYEDFRPRAI